MKIIQRIAEWIVISRDFVKRWWIERRGKDDVRPLTHFGIDCQYYPENGDELFAAWRTTSPFRFVGFYLTPSPSFPNDGGWMTKRSMLKSLGYGFLPLYYARQDPKVSTRSNPALVLIKDAAEGTADATSELPQSAVTLAKQAGFPEGTTIYLDVEQGGLLQSITLDYIRNWVTALRTNGTYRPGIYCSFLDTANQIRGHLGDIDISWWIYNVRCKSATGLSGPSPGCAVSRYAPWPGASGFPEADVWQYAKSPYEPTESSACTGYTERPERTGKQCWVSYGSYSAFVDLNSARLPNPSNG